MDFHETRVPRGPVQDDRWLPQSPPDDAQPYYFQIKLSAKYNDPSLDVHIFMVGFCSRNHATDEVVTGLTSLNFDSKFVRHYGFPVYEEKHRTVGRSVHTSATCISRVHFP